MIRKKTYVIIFISGFILLISGFGSSYYWLTRIYLPEQIDANENARKLADWIEEDAFRIPEDDVMTRTQLQLFIQINESLSYLLQKFRRKFEENSWQIAFEFIRLQPEWAANKYTALKKFDLSPREYDWIVQKVSEFWVYRWKESSVEALSELGWNFEPDTLESRTRPINYELFLEYEEELNRVFEILWPEEKTTQTLVADST